MSLHFPPPLPDPLLCFSDYICSRLISLSLALSSRARSLVYPLDICSSLAPVGNSHPYLKVIFKRSHPLKGHKALGIRFLECVMNILIVKNVAGQHKEMI